MMTESIETSLKPRDQFLLAAEQELVAFERKDVGFARNLNAKRRPNCGCRSSSKHCCATDRHDNRASLVRRRSESVAGLGHLGFSRRVGQTAWPVPRCHYGKSLLRCAYRSKWALEAGRPDRSLDGLRGEPEAVLVLFREVPWTRRHKIATRLDSSSSKRRQKSGPSEEAELGPHLRP